jgi:hypothetical protein
VRAASIIRAMKEALRISATWGYFNDITRRYIPEGSNLHTRRLENPKSNIIETHFPLYLIEI